MKKLILCIGLWFSFFAIAQAAEETCVPFETMQKLSQDLQKKINFYKKESPLYNGQTALYQSQMATESFRLGDVFFQTEVSPEFAANWEAYIGNITLFDQMIFTEESNPDIDASTYLPEMKSILSFHLYVISELIPIYIDDKLKRYFEFKFTESLLKEDRDNMKEALSFKNVRNCRDKASAEAAGLAERKKEPELKDAPLPNLAPITFGTWQTTFESSLPEEFSINPNGENLKSTKKESDTGTSWVKNLFSFLSFGTKDELKNPAEMTSDEFRNNVTNLADRKRSENIRERYTDWRNERSYWMHKTKDISGYNQDLLVQKYKNFMATVVKLIKESEDTIKNVASICQSQKSSLDCWD